MSHTPTASFTAAVALCAGLTIGSLAPSPALAEQISREVGVPLQEANEAIKKQRWDAALVKIKQAQAVKDKKPLEEYQINELAGYVYNNQRNYAEAIKAFEANLNSGRMPANQVTGRIKLLSQLYQQAGNNAKALEYGNRWLKAVPNDPDASLHVAQVQYARKDCKSASRNIETAIDAAVKSGQAPKESWLDLKLTCQHDLNDTDGMTEAREQLVRYYPNKENWGSLLASIANDPELSDPAKLDSYRLMLELGVLKKADVYSEMAQIALDNGMPGEAVKIMEQGFETRVLEDDKNKSRHVRLLEKAKARAQMAQSEVAALSRKAAANPKGDDDVKLGGAHMSAGQYEKAVESLQRGIKKGLKNADEAQVMLGRAFLKLNRKEDARKAFGAVPDDSNLAQVAGLWRVYAVQQPARTAQRD